MAKQNSTYFSPTCFFCGKNNKRRHSRVGRTWACGHCGEINPGPGMVRSMMAKLGSNGHAESREPAAATVPAAPAAAARTVKATRIKGVGEAVVVAAPASKPKPAAVAPAVPPAAQKSNPTRRKSAPPPAPPKSRSLFERVVYG